MFYVFILHQIYTLKKYYTVFLSFKVLNITSRFLHKPCYSFYLILLCFILFLNILSLFISPAFHKHLIPVAVTPQDRRRQRRGQAESCGGPELRQHVAGQQEGARGARLTAGRAEESDEGAADVCGAAQGPANVIQHFMRIYRNVLIHFRRISTLHWFNTPYIPCPTVLYHLML